MTAPSFTPRAMIERLVAFDTTSRHSNLALIDFVESFLASHGVAATRVYNDDKTKANLFATLGPAAPGGIVLSGHTDVVPVDGQAWSSDPFRVIERDGRLYGRGTADMKSFSAIALALVPEFLSRGLTTPLHFALSYDEEVGCLGVRALIENLSAQGFKPRAVVVGEPTGMQVVNAHKGIRAFETTVTGHEVHSSQTHRGVNAIAIAAQLIGRLDALGEALKREGDPSGRFDPPFTSVHVGLIEGGTALNIVPRHCRFVWEFRPLPGSDEPSVLARFEREMEVLRKRMREQASGTDIATVARARVPPFAARVGSPAVALALATTGHNAIHAVSYGTEAGLFEEAGFDTVICGPGDIAQAHQPDEFISLDQVESCVRFFRRLMDQVCRS